jgi:hypothetical protein
MEKKPSKRKQLINDTILSIHSNAFMWLCNCPDRNDEKYKMKDKTITEDKHICSTCACEFTDGEGGTTGFFGPIPVAFCPYCLSSIHEMVDHEE